MTTLPSATVAVLATLSIIAASAPAIPGPAVDEDQAASSWSRTFHPAWRDVARLEPTASTQADFGAATAVDGDVALVGARLADDGVGEVRVFEETEEGWTATATLAPADPAGDERFGTAVAVEDERAIVGAPGEDPSGAAYVYEQTDDGWTQTARLTVASARDLGAAVDLDGDRALVGAPATPLGEQSSAGAVYVFEPGAEGWQRSATLTVPGMVRLGDSVDLDGDRALLGAPWTDGHGEAIIFEQAAGGWSKAGRLVPEDTGWGSSSFGSTLALDGSTALVGEPGYRYSGSDWPDGRAHVFERSPDGWQQTDTWTGPRVFAASVALAGDTALVGATLATTISEENLLGQTGAALVMQRVGLEWVRTATLDPSDRGDWGYMGSSVAIAQTPGPLERTLALVGAPGDTPVDETGDAYLFERRLPAG